MKHHNKQYKVFFKTSQIFFLQAFTRTVTTHLSAGSHLIKKNCYADILRYCIKQLAIPRKPSFILSKFVEKTMEEI